MPGFQNDKMQQQVAFVLGCGGLGCTIALALARLGIKKIFLLDMDTVDISNLNRQILFSKDHVGQNKVDAAAEGLKPHLVGPTQVEKYHLNALTNWSKVVSIAKQCTVIFNNIDVGHYFDYAVISLGKSLGIPVVAGSSYARTWIVEFYAAKQGKSSFSYENKDGDKAIFEKLNPKDIQSFSDISFIPPDDNPNTRQIGSNVLVCSMAGLNTVNHWVQELMGFEMPNFSKVDISSFWKSDDIIAWPPPEEEN
uniref:THIF-type NAD/FAD binding fold domain-containing protein n=1 Tax=Arcella intermedia TaxID=1963864 RepID=A0A6B2LEU1_9EUKA